MTYRWTRVAVLALALLLTVSLGFAKDSGVEWNESGGRWSATLSHDSKIKAGGTLQFENVVGSVEVIGGDNKTATLTIEFELRERASKEEAEELFAELRPEIIERGSKLLLKRDRKFRWQNRAEYSMRIVAHVPKKFDVNGGTGGGSLHASGLEGKVDFASGGGSMTIENHQGFVEVKTGGGSMDLRDVKGDVELATGGGSIELQRVEGNVDGSTGGGGINLADVTAKNGSRLTTGGGSIDIERVKGRLDISTGGGSLRAEECDGDLVAMTGGGAIRLRNMTGDLRASTGGGGIQYRLDKPVNKDIQVDLRTGYGDVDIYIPESLKATLTATIDDFRRTSDLRSDFPIESEEHRGDLTGTVTLNGGGSSISVQTSGSAVSIHKQ